MPKETILVVDDEANIQIFIAYCPTPDQYLTLFSKAYVRACDLTPEGTTIQARLIESEWPEETYTDNFDFPVDRAYVFSHMNEFGVLHNKPWNGVDDGVLWFTNAAITVL